MLLSLDFLQNKKQTQHTKMGEEEQAVVGSNNFSSLDDGKQSWRGIS